MENDINETLGVNELEKEKIFKYEYSEQKLDNNKKFQKWKESMIKYYSHDANLFKCLKDKIYFYNIYDKSKYISGCFIKCPICKKFICQYCLYSSNQEDDKIKCCIKGAIVSLFFYKAPNYINNNNYKMDVELIFLLIPGSNLFFIFSIVCIFLLSELASKKSKESNKMLECSRFLKNIFCCILAYLIGILLSICFFISDIIFIVVMIIISIPFKFYPIKYLIGIYEGL